MASPSGDTLSRFMFEHSHVRGELVTLSASWQAVLERHDYPPVIRALLGQAMAASALLATTIKFDGSLTIQVQGDGPLSLLVVQATADRALRGIAHWQGDDPQGSLQELLGNGRLAITIDPGGGKERYQGIVAIEGASNLAQALEHYFQTSEQLATHLWLAEGDGRAAGFLLQALPGGENEDELWERAEHLAATITDRELLELGHRDILHRLFHEEDVRLLAEEPVRFFCDCSRERIATMLRSLGYDEIQSILNDEGVIGVQCDFCNQKYEFDRIDAEQLFAAADQPPVPRTRH